uniref:Peptidase S1 domain-containing protein n=1 Tax=Anopheles melas TaxID=34690 RepID=A0A182UE29_9DIPT
MQIYREKLPSHRITNGQEATPGQFPFQIALISEFASGNGLCGGSVLTRNFILTAAHCVVSGASILASGGVAIMATAHNRNVQHALERNSAAHPLWDHSSTLRNDIASVRLNSPMTFTTRIQPNIRLPGRSDTRQFGGFTGTVSGFGRTSDASTATSAVVRFTTNPVMTNADCVARWGTTMVQNQNVCLSGAGGRSACNGDSGGALTVQSGGTMQIGVVSFVSVNGCAGGMPS